MTIIACNIIKAIKALKLPENQRRHRQGNDMGEAERGRERGTEEVAEALANWSSHVCICIIMMKTHLNAFNRATDRPSDGAPFPSDSLSNSLSAWQVAYGHGPPKGF